MVKGTWFCANSVLSQKHEREGLLVKELVEQRCEKWYVVRGQDAASLNGKGE